MVASIETSPWRNVPAAWQVRLLAAAIGSATSVVVGVAALLPFAYVGLIIGLVGAPVGATVGALIGPRLATSPRPAGLVLAAAGAATVLGNLLYAFVWGLAEGRGASALDLLAFTLQLGVVFGLGLAVLTVPMTLIVAAIAASALRRMAARAASVWRQSALIVSLVVVATVLVAARSAGQGGDLAARTGNRVPFEYVVLVEPGASGADDWYMLETRSWWKGGMADGSGSSTIGHCSSGSDGLISSDWAIWVTNDPNPVWHDRPSAEPLVTSQNWAAPGAVRLTITIEADGDARWERGIRGGC